MQNRRSQKNKTGRKKTPSKKKKQGVFREIYFYITYIVCFLIMAVFGLLSQSFFAYEQFSRFFMQLIPHIAGTVLLASAATHILIFNDIKVEKIFAVIVFGSAIIMFWLIAFIGGSIRIFVVFTCSLSLICSYFPCYIYRYLKDGAEAEKKTVVCIVVFFLSAMIILLQYKFLDEMIMLWALIPTGIMFVIGGTIAATIVFKKQKHEKYRVLNTIIASVFVLVISFYINWVGMSVINVAFPSERVVVNCLILEKRVSSGSRTPTQFLVKVELNGKKEEIEVPVEVYHSSEIGGIINVVYYSGAMGFPYYIYEYSANSDN